ncbi:MAG TPA: class I SAM-dependent methyltransferase [Kofleriaceae bacterium]|nr:class I SAM-dependent methyltransferase [Kofleriaceae bacterium]
MRADLHEQNRRSWNHATIAHNSHKRDQAAFLRGGGSTLFDEEIALLGDVSGKRLVHLQCNAGPDSLSLAARGAEVTGVDISDEGIAFAQKLSTDSGIAARFERADVYDWLAAAERDSRTFDIVFASYGALCWLSDLRAWARGIAAILAPGGRLVTIEFHPQLGLLDYRDGAYVWLRPVDGASRWAEGVGDYVALSGDALAPSGYQPGVEGFANPEACHEFHWSVADKLDAVASAGLVIETVREYPYANGWRGFPTMLEIAPRKFRLADDAPTIPMMLGFSATSPETGRRA